MTALVGDEARGGRPLKVGLLSLAHVHAESYLEILRDRPDVALLVADPGAPPDATDRGVRHLDRLGARFVASAAELLAWGPDAVVVCSENARHRADVELVAAAGVPILCEKPLATTLADARAMVRACAATGSTLMVAHPVRFSPSLAQLRGELSGGRLGRVLAVSGRNNGRPPLDQRSWFGEPAESGGGALIDHTVHLTDLLGELLDAPPVAVYASANGIIGGDRVAVETSGVTTIDYADGTVAVIDFSWSHPGSYPTWGGLSLTLECERGTAHFDAFADRLQLYTDTSVSGGARWVDYGPDLDALLIDAFLTGVRGGVPVEPTGATALRSMAIVEAGYASLASGQRVRVAPDV